MGPEFELLKLRQFFDHVQLFAQQTENPDASLFFVKRSCLFNSVNRQKSAHLIPFNIGLTVCNFMSRCFSEFVLNFSSLHRVCHLNYYRRISLTDFSQS